MRWTERIHAWHRIWRYRLRTERDELAFLLAQDLAGATVLDIGANRGIYSYWLHRAVGPNGHVIAFEPQPELAVYLRDFRQSFGLNRLTIVEQALSSRTGTAQFVRPKTHWGGGSLVTKPNEAHDVFSVPITTLDEHFAKSSLRPIRFIKCDVENHELDVFRGGSRLLSEDRPVVLFETRDHSREPGHVLSSLQELNYDGFFLSHHGLLPIDDLPEWREKLPKHMRRVSFLNYVFQPCERFSITRAA